MVRNRLLFALVLLALPLTALWAPSCDSGGSGGDIGGGGEDVTLPQDIGGSRESA